MIMENYLKTLFPEGIGRQLLRNYTHKFHNNMHHM